MAALGKSTGVLEQRHHRSLAHASSHFIVPEARQAPAKLLAEASPTDALVHQAAPPGSGYLVQGQFQSLPLLSFSASHKSWPDSGTHQQGEPLASPTSTQVRGCHGPVPPADSPFWESWALTLSSSFCKATGTISSSQTSQLPPTRLWVPGSPALAACLFKQQLRWGKYSQVQDPSAGKGEEE